MGVAARGRNAPVERLANLSDDDQIVDRPHPQWAE
jgi:hypothetical protein